MNLESKTTLFWARTLSTLLVLAIGIGGAVYFVKNKPKPEVIAPEEPKLSVQLQTVVPSSETVTLTAYGTAQAIRTVTLSSEVGGKVTRMPRSLRMGNLVQEGALLVQIDDRDTRTALVDALATVDRLKASLSQVITSEAADRKQLKVANKTLELAEKDFQRIRSLYEENEAVSLTAVENAERSLNQATTSVIQLEQAIELFPSRKQELESQLTAAESRVNQAKLNIERASVRAPFSGRILESHVETDTFVQPGSPLIRLSDDREIELPVTVSADDLMDWIPFEDGEKANGWFPPLPRKPVTIHWNGGSETYTWTGELDRIMDVNASTRMAMLAVRVTGDQLQSNDSGFPLTAGMFCRVEIIGKELKNVFELPRVAVTFDGRVYLSDNGRLKTVDVDVIRSEKDRVLVRGGVTSGDQVIVTRLVAPLEGTLLNVVGN